MVFDMSSFLEQRICIKFCLRNNISGTKTVKMLRTCFGEQCMCKTRIFEWYKMFKEGRESVEDGIRPGRPTTSINKKHIKAVKELMSSDKKLRIRDIAKRVGISYGSCQAILRRENGAPTDEQTPAQKNKVTSNPSEKSHEIPDFLFENLTNILPKIPSSQDKAL